MRIGERGHGQPVGERLCQKGPLVGVEWGIGYLFAVV